MSTGRMLEAEIEARCYYQDRCAKLEKALDNICSWTLTGFVHNKHQAIVEARELLKQHEYSEDKK